MKIRAPFALHTVSVDTSNGQAPGDRWYIVPFRFQIYRSITNAVVKIWDYDRSKAARQYIGHMLHYAGTSSWRPF